MQGLGKDLLIQQLVWGLLERQRGGTRSPVCLDKTDTQTHG